VGELRPGRASRTAAPGDTIRKPAIRMTTENPGLDAPVAALPTSRFVTVILSMNNPNA
jgi:hypothetical protein